MPQREFDVSGRREGILCLLTNVLLCGAVFLTVECLYLSETKRLALGTFVPVILVLIEQGMAWKKPGFGLYWAIHAVILAGLLSAALRGLSLGGTFVIDGVSVAAACVVTAFGVYARVSGKHFVHPKLPLLLLGEGMYAVGTYLESLLLQQAAQITIVISSILCIVWYSLSGVETALSLTHSRAKVPYQQIQRNHRLVTALSLGIFGICALPTAWSSLGTNVIQWMQRLLTAAGGMLVRLLRWLLRSADQESVVEETVSDVGAVYFPELAGETSHNIWLDRLTELLFAVILAGFLFQMIRRLLRRILWLRQAFRRTWQLDADLVESLRPQDEESAAERRPAAEAMRRIWSPDARIRRMYRKMILTGDGAANIRAADTPQELEKVSLLQDAPEIAEISGRSMSSSENERLQERRVRLQKIHELYERARYQGGCLPEDVSAIREQIRQL